MSAISSKALLKTAHPYRYNGGSELEEELDYYNTFYRKYDAQIGRVTGVDIRSEESAAMSVYNFGANNPVMFNDPLGDKFGRGNQLEEHPIDANWSYGTNPGIGNGFAGFGGLGDSGGGGGGNYEAFWGSLVNNFSSFGEGDRFGRNSKGDIGFWQSFSSIDYNSGNGMLDNVNIGSRFINLSSAFGFNGGGFGTMMLPGGNGQSGSKSGSGFFSDLWNSNLLRYLIPDKISIGGNIHAALFIGAGASPINFTFLLRGNDAGLYFTPSINGSISDGVTAGANISINFANYTGNPYNITAAMLNGETIDVSAMIGVGLEGSVGLNYASAGNGYGFIGMGGAIGLGLDASPVTGANIQATIQSTQGTVENIFKFR